MTLTSEDIKNHWKELEKKTRKKGFANGPILGPSEVIREIEKLERQTETKDANKKLDDVIDILKELKGKYDFVLVTKGDAIDTHCWCRYPNSQYILVEYHNRKTRRNGAN